jgi:MoaA/NifB/PqqE/SkfB family radical SAM enzyme
MKQLSIPEPFSGGILLSYQCTNTCKHCMYACSPRWEADWLSVEDAETILSQLADKLRGKYFHSGRIGVNEGIRFSGGEPFLNFDHFRLRILVACGV